MQISALSLENRLSNEGCVVQSTTWAEELRERTRGAWDTGKEGEAMCSKPPDPGDAGGCDGGRAKRRRPLGCGL